MARLVGVGSLLSEALLALTVLGSDEATIAVLVFDTLDHEGERAARVLVGAFSGDDDLQRSVAVLAVRLRRRLTGKGRASGLEVASVEMLDEFDYVAASVAAATVEDLFNRIDRKSIVATADRTRTGALMPIASKLDAAPL
jgi:hypothetical protein